jgi:hypothetical protein
MNTLCCRAWFVAGLILAATLPASASIGAGAANATATLFKESNPIDLTLSADDGAIAPGAVVNIQARIVAWDDLENVRITLQPEGMIELLGSSDFVIGTLVRGAQYPFEIPVRYTGEGRAAVHVTAEAGGVLQSHRSRGGLFTVFRDGRPHAGMGGFIYVETDAIRRDLAAGLITEDEARAQRAAVTDTPLLMDQTPRPASLLVQGLQIPPGLVIPSPQRSAGDAPVRMNGVPNVTVQGQVNWLDENGTSHPCYGCLVEVRDEELIGSDLVADMVTNTDGAYSFLVDNDDGPLSGGRDIFVRVYTGNGVVHVRPVSGTSFSDTYQRNSSVYDNVSDGAVITENFTWDNNGTNSSCGIITGATYIAVYTNIINGGSFISDLPVEWPGGSGSFYDGSRINLATGDRWDWDVLHHEYGHHVMNFFNIEDNPGGPHSSSACNADARGSKSEGNRLAWGEGWPTYFGISGQAVLGLSGLGVPRVGDSSYQDLEDGSLQYDLETNQPFGGEDNERAVMSTFWDLFDSNSDGRDNISVSHQILFDRVNAADPTILSSAWAALRAPLTNSQDLGYGGAAADHLIGPTLVSPTAGTLVTPSNLNFSWDRRVGCSTTWDGNNFDLVFYHPGTFAKILTVPGIGTNSASISPAQLATLITASHNVLWAVEGRNTSVPATGPYLGENFAITVNRPPVADAGPDQLNVECTTPTTTPVALDGTGSSDPDGDGLTYEWSATGVTFDDANSATPTGQFPKGTTVVTLEVSDGFQTDTDQMTVRVVDTTPPEITCPLAIDVECSEHGGTPASDPAIQAFLTGATATDDCDASVDITDDAPAFFALGTTTVTFTATDDEGLTNTCQADVNVIDTTPPTLTLSIDPEVLWPPNHKLADIQATVVVEDICDPNPTFVLTSITSNEPDNGTGDGDTVNDIQNADMGTPDVAFRLRSERKGNGGGRKYTITYTASDISNNMTVNSICVRVPHDMSGYALASTGFNPAGTAFDPTQKFLVLIIPSEAPGTGMIVEAGDQGVLEIGFESATGSGILTDDATMPKKFGPLDAREIDATRAYVGNMAGVVRPVTTQLHDVNGDGKPDAIFWYRIADIEGLAGGSALVGSSIGLHYQVDENRNYLISDIFALGAPVPMVLESSGEQLEMPNPGPEEPAAASPASKPGEIADADPDLAAGTPASPADPARLELPGVTEFAGVFPNPLDRRATIGFTLAGAEHVRLAVFDLRGARVQTIADRTFGAGRYQIGWNGRGLPRGIYLVRFEAGSYQQTQKVAIMW